MPIRFLCFTCSRGYWTRLADTRCPRCGHVPKWKDLGMQLSMYVVGLAALASLIAILADTLG
jgi:hypothetical protein